MWHKIRVGALIVFVLSSVGAFTQNLSNKGKEFWVGYGHHQFFETGSNTQEMVLYLSAEQSAVVTISINGTAFSQTYLIPANSVIATSPIPKSGTYDCRLYSGAPGFTGALSEGVSDRGIHIVSDVPIVAYAHIYGSASSGATMLMPVETYGYSYVSINSQQRYGSNNCFSWVYVIAKQNNTRVEITPSVPTRGGRPANVPFTITLNKGQVYQVLGALITSSDGYDLTGTKVKSVANAAGECYPIAVFAGSSRTYITCSGTGGNGGDNIIQQIFPFQAWGKRYLTAPTSNYNIASSLMTNLYRVAVKDPSTVVKRNGLPLTGLVNNTYYDFESSTADYIEADKPILVAQYMPSNGGCNNVATSAGDPEMMYLSPIEQAIKKVGFYRNTRESITTNYLTLILPTAGLSSLTIDGVGASGFSHTYPHPNLPGYSVVIKRWNAAQAQCLVQSDSAFTAVTYGLGSVESYGYNAGTLINNLNVAGLVHNTPDSTNTTNLYTCRNTPVQLSMLVAYKPELMIWKLSQVPRISPNTDYIDYNPIPVDSVIKDGAWFYKYDLPGTYAFSDTGNILIPVQNTHPSIENCNHSEVVTFSISVKKSPVADFSILHTGCISDTVHFSSPDTTNNGYPVNKWIWNFADGTSEYISDPSRLFVSSGPQVVKLRVISSEGCVGDTSKTINIYARPVTNFGVSSLSVCQGTAIQFSDTSSYGGTTPLTSWYWDYGNGNIVNDSNNTLQQITFPGYGDYTVKHLVRVSNTCISDTITKLIHVSANPVPSFLYPAGCLPPDGLVQFNNTTSVADGQALSYSWNFGDPYSSTSNPDTSSQQSPSHIYTLGSYSIHYHVTTENGCSSDTTVSTTFNVRAMLSYPSLPPVCESVKGSISLASATVTNGVSGMGYYLGTAIDSLGNFHPSQSGPGNFTIWYVFTSSGGCKDSVSATVKVYPKPVSSFSVNSKICINELATFTDQSTIPSGSISSWNWDFGDGNRISYNNGNSFSRSYTGFNNYTIKLVTLSDNGCASDTVSQVIGVHAMPLANFNLPASICMPEGNGSFTNISNIPDSSGLSYLWNFGDGSDPVNDVSPSHTFTAYGPFNIHLTATSSYGCIKDTVKVLSAFFDKPIANFAVYPDTLCQGSNNVFTDQSTAPNSTITNWNWEFGDGSFSTTREPVKRFSLPGLYNVTLKVKNAAGCISNAFTKQVTVYLQPVINAGPSFIVPEGTLITFNPRANDSTELHFLWTPASDFADPSILRPSIVVTHDQTYTLTATGQGHCSSTDTLTVKVLKPVHVPNAFSPNGDGINDTWQIPNLADYPGCTVEVYNRYGQLVYQSYGYSTSWNGTYKGTPLPFATYYYIITLKNGFKPMTGSVTIIR